MLGNKRIVLKWTKEQGITLVALVITIIILIILAAVAIINVQDSGLVDKTIKSAEEYAKAQEKEQADMDELEERMKDLTSQIDDITGGSGDDTEDDGKDDPNSVYNVLKAGNYINLKCSIEGIEEEKVITCVVLYDKDYDTKNNTNYGIQIVAESPTEKVILGKGDPRIETDADENVKQGNDFIKAQWSYNNAVKTLNKAAEKYSANSIKETRSIGSIPDNKNSEKKEPFTSSETYMSAYTGKFSDTDNNAGTEESLEESKTRDWKQLETINSKGFKDTTYASNYWLATHYVRSDSSDTYFYIPSIDTNGKLNTSNLCHVDSTGKENCNKREYGLRPVFILKAGTKINQDATHDGSAEHPYEL